MKCRHCKNNMDIQISAKYRQDTEEEIFLRYKCKFCNSENEIEISKQQNMFKNLNF